MNLNNYNINTQHAIVGLSPLTTLD